MVTIGGKADSSLIAAATAAAKVDQPVSTAKITEARVQQYGSFMEAMGKVYDNEKAKIEAERKPMEDAMTNILAKQADGTLKDMEIEGIQYYIDDKREELKKLPKGKKGEAERQKLLADLNKFYSSYEVGNVENQTRATLIDAGEYDAYNMGGVIKSTGKTISPDQALNLFKKLGEQDYDFSVDDNERSYDIKLDDGSYFTVKQSDLKGIFKTKNKDAIAAFEVIHSYALTLGQAKGSNFDPTEFRNNIKNNVFKSDGGFSTIIKIPQKGNTKSYYEALHKEQGFMTAEMFSILGELDPKLLKEYDVNKSGDLDAGDFTNEENYKKLIIALTEPTDPSFNRELAYNFAADWHTGSAMQSNFDMGRDILKGKGGEETPTGTKFPWGNSIGTSKPVENVISWWKGEIPVSDIKFSNKDEIYFDKDSNQWIFYDASFVNPNTNVKGTDIPINTGSGNGVGLDFIIQAVGNNTTQFKDAYQKFDFSIGFNAQAASTGGGKTEVDGVAEKINQDLTDIFNQDVTAKEKRDLIEAYVDNAETLSGLKVFREGRTQGGKTYMFKFGGKKKKISSDDQSAIIDYILGIHKQNLSK